MQSLGPCWPSGWSHTAYPTDSPEESFSLSGMASSPESPYKEADVETRPARGEMFIDIVNGVVHSPSAG